MTTHAYTHGILHRPLLQAIHTAGWKIVTLYIALCEAMVMCGNDNWLLHHTCGVRSIKIDPWPGGPKSYLWQPVIMITFPVVQQTDGRATDSCFSLIGPRQCGILMVLAGWLAAIYNVSTPSRTLVASTTAAWLCTLWQTDGRATDSW